MKDSIWRKLGQLRKSKPVELFIILIPVVVCIIWAIFIGKDFNWDARNYHLYSGFSVLHDRIAYDFMPSGPQSYLNPIGYVPFYLLVTFFDNPIFVGVILAAIHSVVIYLAYGIINSAIADVSKRVHGFAALALALTTNIYWHQVGSSFIDVYVCILVLFGLLALLNYLEKPLLHWACLSALAVGVAVGIKMTSFVFSVALSVCAVFIILVKFRKIGHFICFCLSGILGGVLFQGWWAYTVYQEYGNPFFPFFNDIFCSSYSLCESIVVYRFIPESISDALLFPLHVMLASPWLYIEILSPDLRLIAFFVIMPFCIVAIYRKKRESDYKLIIICVFWVVSYFLWLFTTAIGRYGMPIFVLIGIVVALALFRALGMKRGLLYLVMICIMQLYVFAYNSDHRWQGTSWGDEYSGYDMPEYLVDDAYLYISAAKQSNTFIAPYVHRDSIFVNITGQLPLQTEKAIDLLHKKADEMSGRARFYVEYVEQKEGDGESLVGWAPMYNGVLERYGWSFDENKCQYISNEHNYESETHDAYLVICDLLYDSTLVAENKNGRMHADSVFDLIEEYCSMHFNPSSGVTERYLTGWMRYYVGTGRTLHLLKNDVTLSSTIHVDHLHLGSDSDWLKKPNESATLCRKEWVQKKFQLKAFYE